MSQEIARQRRRRRRKHARAQAALVLEVGAELARHFAELDLSLLPWANYAAWHLVRGYNIR